MRLFGYYALHSVWNQLRRLFKTWVLVVFLVCALIGGLIGFGVASLEDAAAPQEETEQVIEEIEEEAEAAVSFEEATGVKGMEVFELAAGAIVLAVFVIQVFMAEGGSKIFLPADVNLLFASPMKPQSVLMFRLATQLGMAVVGSLYLLFQIPNLMLNLGVSFGSAISVIIAWCLTLIAGKLIQLLTYVLSYRYPVFKKNLHNILYVLGALFIGGFWLYTRFYKGNLLQAAVSFFNGRWTRLIPFWGWIKGFAVYAMEGKALYALGLLVLLGAGCAALVWLIWNMKIDFYEDAMIKSQELAEALEAAQSSRAGVTVKRKKDRSDKLERDGFHYGEGANVYFYKTLYNRFRFGHLKYFTKTSETYLVAGLLMGAFLRFVAESDNVMPLALMLGVLVFFRAIGNPLNADTKMDYFRLIPEKTWKKLFWSVAGGSVNCLLDLLPGMIAGSLLMAVNPFKVLVYLPLIISVDFYATSVGTFLDLSIPRSTGTTFRQTIQILFIYFGLIPDIAIMAVGLALHYASWSSLICTLINLYLGLLFLGLSGVFVEPYGGRSIETDGSETVDVKKTRKVFSETGIACVIILVSASLLQLGLVGIFRDSLETIAASEWGIWLITFLPMYLVAVPLGLLYLKKVPAFGIEKKSLNRKQLLILPVICIFLMYSGNLIGTLVTSLLSNLVTPEPVVNPLMNLTSSGTIVQRLIFMVILAPVIEEYIFRKQLIDRLHIYGGRQAVILSGIMFGLFHGNFSQLFYAAALGILFGYVYLKTGKLRYTIGLHMTVNFMGGILGPQLLENASDAISKFESMSMLSPWKFLLQPSILFLAVYLILMLVLVLAGFVLLVQQMREVSFEKEIHQLPKGKVLAVTLQNPGMILFMITCLGLIVYTLI